MNRTFGSFSLALLLCCFPSSGEAQQRGDDKLAALRGLKIDAGTITQVERDATATKTVVKLVLHPATGS
ncbi:MAG TPA: hypothetical protein P5016_21090, partial [Verrucomicrobiales bacterium]|nr:hypothetical protein [Verrucomicrobiales bacterium]